MNLKEKKAKTPINVSDSIITPFAYKHLIFGLKWSSICGGLPFEFDGRKQTLGITTKSVRYWTVVMLFQTTRLAYYCSAMGLRLWYYEHDKVDKDTMFDTAYGFVVTMMKLILLTTSLNVGGFQRYEFCSCINGTVLHYAQMKGKLPLSVPWIIIQ